MDLLQALAESRLAVALRQPGMVYPLVNAAHIMSLGLVFGTIAVLDLRLLGLFGAYSVRELGPPLSLVSAFGVVLALVTGFLLFSVRPDAYARNAAFLVEDLPGRAGRCQCVDSAPQPSLAAYPRGRRCSYQRESLGRPLSRHLDIRYCGRPVDCLPVMKIQRGGI